MRPSPEDGEAGLRAGCLPEALRGSLAGSRAHRSGQRRACARDGSARPVAGELHISLRKRRSWSPRHGGGSQDCWGHEVARKRLSTTTSSKCDPHRTAGPAGVRPWWAARAPERARPGTRAALRRHRALAVALSPDTGAPLQPDEVPIAPLPTSQQLGSAGSETQSARVPGRTQTKRRASRVQPPPAKPPCRLRPD